MKGNEEKEMLSFLSSTKRDNNVFFLKQKKNATEVKKKMAKQHFYCSKQPKNYEKLSYCSKQPKNFYCMVRNL